MGHYGHMRTFTCVDRTCTRKKIERSNRYNRHNDPKTNAVEKRTNENRKNVTFRGVYTFLDSKTDI